MPEKALFFEFTSYRYDAEEKRIVFKYAVKIKSGELLEYAETVILPKAPDFSKTSEKLFHKILQNLHLAVGISYYKLHCAKKIKVNRQMSKNEADFWDLFYSKGLGEFLYRNKLNPKIIAKFPFKKDKKTEYFRITRNGKMLVGVGGGKDSIVSVELLKKYGADFSMFYVETEKRSGLVENLMKKMGDKSFAMEGASESFKIERKIGEIKIFRKLDEKLLDPSSDCYKGHIPISGIYAFLGILAAAIYNYSYFVVSNEFSSNFGNTVYKGRAINHQWSKSSEFENLFQDYIENNISPDLAYFSLMRPFYEIRIMDLFSKYQQYFNEFSSCNNNFKTADNSLDSKGLWCGKCPKCIFAFLMLSPFISKEKLVSIFGDNYFTHVDPLITLRDILGFGKIKPFDCVGTFDEAKTAFYMSREKFRDDLAGEIFLPKIDPDDNRYVLYNAKITFKMYFQGKAKPIELIKKVFKAQPSNVPDYLKFLGMDKALVLGYGKEGKVTERYLKANFPELKIEVGDAGLDSEYLSKQKDFDIAIRSPGVPKEVVKIPYTTATNIFFSFVRQVPGAKIIGITGTKGKSTTASLIWHILRKAGRNVELLGNIGTPMLEALLDKKIKKDAIYVIELSSYQLDDIKYSPDIAVVTSLFPEHMDYHYNIKNYYVAKKNILKYQTKEDIFVFNPKNKKLAGWAKKGMAKPVYPLKEIPVGDSEIKIQGEHNKDNIRLAVAVARALEIPDEAIKAGVRTFEGLPHRLEFVGEYSGIKFYDDAISTTPESTIVAIKSLGNIGTIFLGGQDRGYKFSELQKSIKKNKIKNIVLFPDSGGKIFKTGRRGLNILETSSMEEAVRFAYKNTLAGENCLLSCASPSYSLWKNFEEKGDQFKNFVKELAKSEKAS